MRRSDIRMSDQQIGCCGCALVVLIGVPMVLVVIGVLALAGL